LHVGYFTSLVNLLKDNNGHNKDVFIIALIYKFSTH